MTWKVKDYFDNGGILKWGEDMPPGTREAMEKGEVFTLMDKHGKPYSILCHDSYGTLRESMKETWGTSKAFLGLT